MNSKNKSAGSNTSADKDQKKSTGSDSNQRMSASQRATEQARRGEPLQPDNPKERSPKQENL